MRVLTEDVEDHRSAIEGGSTEQLLQVELLAGREFVVEHNGVGIDRETQLLELLDLALADVPGVIGAVAPLHHAFDDVGTSGVDEQCQFVKACIDGLVSRPRVGDRNKHDLLPDRAVDQRARQRLVVRSVAHQTSISIVPT